jgi:hypothetical protein
LTGRANIFPEPTFFPKTGKLISWTRFIGEWWKMNQASIEHLCMWFIRIPTPNSINRYHVYTNWPLFIIFCGLIGSLDWFLGWMVDY